jgi:hypothetical protein
LTRAHAHVASDEARAALAFLGHVDAAPGA